ncbi:MAG: iron ABC transporter permease [Deltaproteobacteria bacterium]|nr:iron ABC transporter permease [Deltaproteobacteria bacterium]
MTRGGRAPVLGAGGLLLAVAATVALGSGAAAIPLGRVARILGASTGLDPGDGIPAWERLVVLDVRLPRIVTGSLVGGGLAVAGAALQALLRNPLADPGVLGVASGGALGAVLALHLGLAALTTWAVPGLAILGAAAATFAVYAIAARRGALPAGTLLLAGVAVGSLASALTSLVLSFTLEEYEQGRQVFRWLMGGLEARTWADVALVTPTTLLGSAALLASSRELDALLLGEVHALSVGVDVGRVRRRLLGATSLVVGGAVAVSGVLAFVGLLVPHVVRALLGPSHARLLPACLVNGAALVVVADLACRLLRAPEELRLGVMTAGLGAPFFLWLLVARRRDEEGA